MSPLQSRTSGLCLAPEDPFGDSALGPVLGRYRFFGADVRNPHCAILDLFRERVLGPEGIDRGLFLVGTFRPLGLLHAELLHRDLAA